MKKIAFALLIFNCLCRAASAQNIDAASKGIKTKTVNGCLMAANLNIVQNVSRAKDYTILLNAIKIAGLAETFESKGPITFFAPTNSAFAAIPAGRLDSLMKAENKFLLSSIIAYHAVAGKLSVKDIARNIKEHKGQTTLVTLAGSKLVATIDANRNIILTDENGGHCIITQFDAEQSNGILHVVNSVFMPKNQVI